MISISLRNNKRLIDLDTEGIGATHFHVKGHMYIVTAMMYLYSNEIDVNPFSIMEVLATEQAKNAVEEIGGLEYLVALSEAYIKDESFPIYIKKVQQAHTRYELINASCDSLEFLLTDEVEVLNPSEILEEVEKRITIDVENTNENVYHIGEEIEELLEERMNNPQKIPGLETGWEIFDEYTGGFCPGELSIVCAPSKTGKSITLSNWARRICIEDQVPGLYIDTEMSSTEQQDRILAALSKVKEKTIINGTFALNQDDVVKVKDAIGKMKEGKLFHINMPYFTLEEITRVIKEYVLKHDVKIVFFDYIKLSSAMNGKKNTQEYQMLGDLCSGLKEIASDLGITIVSACQTNRNDLDSKEPDASNIGGSYRILQLASKLMFLINKSDEQIAEDGVTNGNQQIIIKYQRKGQSDCPPININFFREICRQQEV